LKWHKKRGVSGKHKVNVLRQERAARIASLEESRQAVLQDYAAGRCDDVSVMEILAAIGSAINAERAAMNIDV